MPPLLGVYVFTDRLAFAATDWCFRLHGWPFMPPLLGVYVFTDRLAFAAADWCFRLHGWPLCRCCWASTSSPTGLPSPPPTGVSASTAVLLCRRCWASTSSPTGRLVRRRLVFSPARLAFMPLLLGVYVFTDRLAFAAADWCFRLHGWPIMPPLLVFPPARLAFYAAVVGRLRLHRPACLRRRRLVFPPARLAFMPLLLGVHVFTDRLAFAAADWCFRQHGWPIMLPLLGVYVFTDRPPRPPPTGVFACTAGLYAAVVGRLRLHRPACLRRRRLVFPPARLAFMPPLLGVYVFTDRLAFAATDWCFRLHGWPLCRRCWASTSSPTGRLVRRRLVFPPARLAYYAAVVGRLRLHRPAASSAADWCFRLHGWPLCRCCWASTSSPTGLPLPPPTGVSACTAGLYDRCCWASTSSPTGLPSPPPTGVSASTAGLLCRRCWASTSSPTGRLVRRRLVFPPARLAFYAAVVGRLRLHRPACLRRRRLVFSPARLAFMPLLLGVHVFTDRLAFAAADWCFRQHGWPIMPPLLGVYVFTDRPPRPPPTGVFACTAGLYAAVVGRLRLHRPACLRHRRLVFPPALLAFMPPLLGVYVFTDRLAFAATDWCFRLHGWPLCRRCWASTSSPTGRLVRRRLVFPPARLAYYAAVVGRLRLHRPAASSAADWCFRLHGWPLCRCCWASTSSPTGLPLPPPTGVSACTAGLYDRCCWASTSSPTGLPSPPPTGVSASTAGLLCRRCWASTSSPTGRLVRRRLVFPPARLAYYAAVVGRLRLHRPACLRRLRLVFPPARLAYYAAVGGRLRLHRPATASAADWCHRLHGWPVITPTDAIFFTAGYIAVTTNRHQYLQHKLPTFAMAADWFLHFHGYMILPVLISLIFFTAGHLVCC
uniref:cysteine dioxygenase n=1 Tax=Oryza sativa subsp. japonica TaxID=39947 RepID=Q6EP25_ORYSJ|nr:HGWP repeat containing protein-like [Oryza sativa Japonica Group]BAE79752.1 HGWP repeat containing protein-like [Oryza sativa Japonica Group]